MSQDYTTPSKTDEKVPSSQNILWTADFKCPENSMILRREVPVDTQNEDRFSPMNGFAFSPLAQEYFSVDNAVLAGIVLLMAQKNPKGLERIIVKYMDSVTKILTTVVESGKTHPLTALNASTCYAVTAHRFGVITDSGYLKMADQTRAIVDKIIQLQWGAELIGQSGLLAGLSSFVEGNKITTKTGVSDRGSTVEKSLQGLGALANLKAIAVP